ncbi:MAG: quercetin 2,3-dioxygenase [Anaerolineae bacterium]|nr:quercetin 2,3-dioxygenase [Anaerolineae bacterium]
MDTTQSVVPTAITLAANEGRALWHLGALLVFKALGSETNGQFWAFEGLADHNMAVPLHVHDRDDEFWYVLEGEIAFYIGDEVRTLTAGSFAYVPRKVPHTFQIRSETARWFGVGTPAGFDQWFFETGEQAKSLTLPPPPPPPDADALNTLVASLKAYGTDTLGPPPTR